MLYLGDLLIQEGMGLELPLSLLVDLDLSTDILSELLETLFVKLVEIKGFPAVFASSRSL